MFVACGIYPTGDKHTISTLLIKPIFSVLAHAEKQFFSKLVFESISFCSWSQKRCCCFLTFGFALWLDFPGQKVTTMLVETRIKMTKYRIRRD